MEENKIFKYSNNITNSLIIFNNNIKNYLLEDDDIRNYRNIFRSIDTNYNLFDNMDYERKQELLILIKEFYKPLDEYYDKYLKKYESMFEIFNVNKNDYDNIEYRYHYNKYANKILNINYEIDTFLKVYKRENELNLHYVERDF